MVTRVGENDVSRRIECHSEWCTHRTRDDRHTVCHSGGPFLHAAVASIQDEHRTVPIEHDRRR